MPLRYVLEQRLSPTEDKGVDDQPKLVDQALVHQAADQRGAADGMHVLAGLLFHSPDLFDVANDPRVLPGDVGQSPGQDDMGRSCREAGVGDLALRRHLAREGQNALGVRQDGAPVLLVAGVHSAPEDTRVDLREQIEGILPRVDPIEFPVGTLDEAVHRHHQRGDDLSHFMGPFESEGGPSCQSTATGPSLPAYP